MLACAAGAMAAMGCVPADTGGGGGVGSFSRGFVLIRGDRNVYLADSSNFSDLIQITTSGSNRHPSLSRDGRQIVFVHSGNELDLVRATSGAVATTLYPARSGQSNLRTPVFSPDSSFVVFAYDRSGTSYLARINVDGSRSSFRELTSAPISYGAPSFYSDGSSVLAIAGSSSSDYRQLVRVDVNTGTATNVASNLGTQACSIANRAAISPDGTRAALDGRLFSAGSCSGAVRIFVMTLLGTQTLSQLTSYPAEPSANDGFPTWVGADQVGFSSSVGGADNVYILPASGSMISGGLRVPSAIEPYYGPN